MAAGDDKKAKIAKKEAKFQRIATLCASHSKVLIVEAQNIGSKHMQSIRREIRQCGGQLLMGKNTQIRKALRMNMSKFPRYETLLPHVRGNCGFVFAKDSADLGKMRKMIHANKVGAPAKAGSIAPCPVVVSAGPTGMEPTMTSFLQALNIPSKIVKGQVEIMSDVQLIAEGEKVSASASNLLLRLNIQPFAYNLKVNVVFDNGATYAASLLDMGEREVLAMFGNGVNQVAGISLVTNYPTFALVPKLLVRGLGDLMAISIETDYTFEKTEDIKKYLADPSAFKHLVAAAPAGGAAAGGGAAAAKEAAKEEEKEESDDFGGGGLFGGGEEEY